MPSQDGNEPLVGNFEKEIPIERSLVGSLVDSYGFKKDGLIKKTMSITIHGQPHHLVSYYKPEDVISGIFETPKDSAYLKSILISNEIINNQNFRIPFETKKDVVRKSAGNGAQQQQQLHQSQIQRQMHQMHSPHHSMSQAAPPHLSYMAGPPQALGGPQDYGMSTYEMDDLLKNGGGASAAGTTSGGLPFFRTSQTLNNSSYMTTAANTGYRSYGPSSIVQPQEQSQNQFLQSEYYSTVTASTTAAGTPTTTTTSSPYQSGRLATSNNVYLPSLPPLAQKYSYQNYNNTSTAGPFSTVGVEPAQQVQPEQQTMQQQHFAESDPRGLPETSVATSTQGCSPRPLITTVQQQLHQPQQPISTSYSYNYGTNCQGQW